MAKNTPTPRARREMVRRHLSDEYQGALIGSLFGDKVGVVSCRVGVAWSACWQSVSSRSSAKAK